MISNDEFVFFKLVVVGKEIPGATVRRNYHLANIEKKRRASREYAT